MDSVNTEIPNAEETSPSANPVGPALGAQAPSASAAISVTPKAVEMARKQLAKRGTPGSAIRVGLRGGGCSGFTYVIEYADDAPRERDRVFEYDGVRFFVDPKSLIYLAGTVLDWESTLMRQGFKFKNPQEAAGCGCGHSFSV
jgi:iron-sulfur cluster assembly protein